MVRRIVTGHDAHGRSVVASAEELAESPLGSGASSLSVWASDAPACYPDDGAPPPPSLVPFPPIGGCRVSIVRLKAGGTEAFDAFVAEGLHQFAEPGQSGMHRTATTDFVLVLSGDLGLQLDSGAEVELHAGDIVVQNGTRHRWVNRGDTDVVFATFVVGAEHAEAPTA